MASNGKEAVVISNGNLGALQALVDAPVWCRFRLDGQDIQVECHRVSQAVDEQVRALRRLAQPPYTKPTGTTPGYYDESNAAYLIARDKNDKIARSVVIYAGCPAVSASKPGLVVAETIHDYVRGLLTDTVLDMLAMTIQAGGLELVDRANFTLTGTSES